MSKKKEGTRIFKNAFLFCYFYLVMSVVLNGSAMFKEDMSFNPSPIETMWYWQHLVFSVSFDNALIVLIVSAVLIFTDTRKFIK